MTAEWDTIPVVRCVFTLSWRRRKRRRRRRKKKENAFLPRFFDEYYTVRMRASSRWQKGYFWYRPWWKPDMPIEKEYELGQWPNRRRTATVQRWPQVCVSGISCCEKWDSFKRLKVTIVGLKKRGGRGRRKKKERKKKTRYPQLVLHS